MELLTVSLHGKASIAGDLIYVMNHVLLELLWRTSNVPRGVVFGGYAHLFGYRDLKLSSAVYSTLKRYRPTGSQVALQRINVSMLYLKPAQTLVTMFEDMVMHYVVLHPQCTGLYTASDSRVLRGQLLPERRYYPI